MEPSSRPTRRQLLTALVVTGAGLPLTACGRADSVEADDEADVALVTAAIADEERLLDYCIKAGRPQPGLGEVVRELARVQRRHVSVLRDSLTTADPPRRPAVVAVPRDPDAAAIELLARVERARDDRRRDCQAAESGLLARLLAAMSASHAVTATSLSESS